MFVFEFYQRVDSLSWTNKNHRNYSLGRFKIFFPAFLSTILVYNTIKPNEDILQKEERMHC